MAILIQQNDFPAVLIIKSDNILFFQKVFYACVSNRDLISLRADINRFPDAIAAN